MYQDLGSFLTDVQRIVLGTQLQKTCMAVSPHSPETHRPPSSNRRRILAMQDCWHRRDIFCQLRAPNTEHVTWEFRGRRLQCPQGRHAGSVRAHPFSALS